MRTRQPLSTVAAAAFLLLATVSGAKGGQKVTGSGHSFYVPKSSETYKLSDGRSVQQAAEAGYTTTAQPDNPLNMNTENCSGTTITSADGKTGTGSGYCVSFDPSGDAAWIWWRGDLDGGTWGFIDGTGKFKGVDGGGTWKTARQWPDGKFVNSWEGTWQTK
jgi:hypothetical protein